MIRLVRFIAWHRHRTALLAFGIGGFLASYLYGAAFRQAAGTTAEAQAEFGRVTMLAAKEFAFIIPVPVHPETLGGYEQYKWLSGAIAMMMIWAAVAAIGVARGDEDKGITDEWLAAGVGRTRLLLARSLAFALVLLTVCLLSVLGIVAIAPTVQQDPNFLGEMGKAMSMTAGIFAGFTLALFVAQLPMERQTATAFGVGVIVLLLIVNGIADTVTGASWIGLVSPFHWMNLTSSAAPGGTFDGVATLGLVVAALVLLGGSILVFQRRDLGAGLVRWGAGRARAAVREASKSFMLRWSFTEGLWEQRVGLLVWAACTLALAVLMVSVTKSLTDAIMSDKNIAAMFQRVIPGPAYSAFLGFLWFSFSLLILAGYAVVQVSRWAAQDQDGRVEMLLSAPVSRSRVVIDRALEFAIASLLIVVGGYIGVAAAAPSAGLGVNTGQLLTASGMMWPFALAFGGLGVAVASRWPRIAVPLLAAFAAVEYFLGDLAPIFRFPTWVADLSVFHMVGNPLVGDVSVAPVLWMALVFVVGFGAAVIAMRRRDVSTL